MPKKKKKKPTKAVRSTSKRAMRGKQTAGSGRYVRSK